MNQRKVLYGAYFLLVFLLVSAVSPNSGKAGYLTRDGAWCWFSDPRAIYMGDGVVITGWVKNDGTVEASSFNPKTSAIQFKTLFPKLQSDDHNNPAFTQTAKGNIIASYTSHSGKDGFYQNKTTEGTDIQSFSEAEKIVLLDSNELMQFPKVHVTYANPFRLESENSRIYCFGRWTGYKPNMMWSDDEGASWTKSKVIITNYPFDPSNRPYAKYYSDGKSRIHITFTDGHPRVEPTNSVYYAYYENGAFYKACGKKISDAENLPFEVKDASVIYVASEIEGRAWIADIAQDKNGYPVVLFTKSPSESDHRYWYAKHDGMQWSSYEMCKSGKWFPQTQTGSKEKEPHYFGNMCLNPEDPDVVYLSRQVNGVFEIERWETKDNGKNWDVESITSKSQFDNVRPYVPRGNAGESEIVLWMENQKYIHYTNYQTSIKYYVRR